VKAFGSAQFQSVRIEKGKTGPQGNGGGERRGGGGSGTTADGGEGLHSVAKKKAVLPVGLS